MGGCKTWVHQLMRLVVKSGGFASTETQCGHRGLVAMWEATLFCLFSAQCWMVQSPAPAPALSMGESNFAGCLPEDSSSHLVVEALKDFPPLVSHHPRFTSTPVVVAAADAH